MPVIKRLLGNIYLAFIHSSWLTDSWIVGIYWLIRDMADSLFICSLFSVSENTSGPHQRPGVTFCIWGPCLYCMQWHCFFLFLFLFCLRRDSNTWVNVRLHRTLDWPCPGSWWTRGDELSPSLLTCCGNIAGQAGAREGQDPQGCAAHLQSGWCPAKVKLGRSKNKKQAVLVRTWGKGNPWALLVGMWIVQPLWGHCAGSSKLKIEPQALSLLAFKEDEIGNLKRYMRPMFMEVLCTLLKTWKQLPYPMMREWIKKLQWQCVHTCDHSSAIKEKEILPFQYMDGTWGH